MTMQNLKQNSIFVLLPLILGIATASFVATVNATEGTTEGTTRQEN
jgi:hypothetical protein